MKPPEAPTPAQLPNIRLSLAISTLCASHAIVVTLRPTALVVEDRGERVLPQGGAPEVGLSPNEVFVPLNARA